MPEVTVSALYVYPIKAMRGTALPDAHVERRGIRHDRRWMLVDDAGKFLSQREHAKLALVDVRVEANGLLVQAPGHASLEIPFRASGRRRTVTIWSSSCEAVSVSTEAARYFSDYLGAPCDLVHMPDTTERVASLKYGRPTDLVGFADGFALLLASTESLADLNARANAEIPMDRMRPNVVVSGAPPFAEDAWKEITMGALAFRVVKPCDRCVVTTVDQATGAKGREPLATLARFRKIGNDVFFGQNLAHDTEGTLHVGDPVHVASPPPAA